MRSLKGLGLASPKWSGKGKSVGRDGSLRLRQVKEMKRAVRAWISRKGWYVTILFEDGSRTTISFKEFLRAFRDYSRAVSEYASFVWASMGGDERAYWVATEVERRLLRARSSN